MDKKKELKEKYKQMKPNMGVYVIRCSANDKCYICSTKNLNGKINRDRFSLELGSHSNNELQKAWNTFGKDKFTIDIIDTLEYDKDESKIDYLEDLETLKEIWKEKLCNSIDL
jgi:hypothetical protein